MKKTILTICLLTAIVYVAGQSLLAPTSQVFYHRFEPKPFYPVPDVDPDPDPDPDTVSEPVNPYRRLYFVHGLGGNGSSWSRVPDACMNENLHINGFPARTCKVSTPDYDEATGSTLYFAANNIFDKIQSTNRTDYFTGIDPNRAILIGHSQGGVLCRTIIHNDLVSTAPRPKYGNDYGGFISVASSLKGAKILNNRDHIITMASDACSMLAVGPIAERKLINAIFKIFLGSDYVRVGCETVTTTLLPVFFQKYYANITNDYLDGAAWLNTLDRDINDQRYRSMPKIAIYCVEPQDNIFWRTMEWLINDPNQVEHFEANKDLEFYKSTIMPMMSKYYVGYTRALNEWAALQSASYKNCVGLKYIWEMQVAVANDKKNSWYQGILWFNTVNSQWQNIIGALQYEQQTKIVYDCYKCESGMAFRGTNQYTCYQWNCKDMTPRAVHEYKWVLKENDGIVTKESASYLPCASVQPIQVWRNAVENNIDKGTSHMQVRNDEGIKKVLKLVFDGYYGDFFYTQTK